MPWIIAIWLPVFIGQRVGPDRSRTIFGRIGFWLFWLAAILAVMLVIVTRPLVPFRLDFGAGGPAARHSDLGGIVGRAKAAAVCGPVPDAGGWCCARFHRILHK